MRILAFDQASRVSGYSVFDDSKLVDYGKFEFTDDNIDKRLTLIRLKVKALINQYQPDKVIYEDIQEQNNILTFKILAMVYGVIGQLLDEMQIPHESTLAIQWKSKLGIKGKQRAEQKRNAQQYVLENYGVKATQDESDAICIGAAYNKTQRCAWSS